MTTNFTYKYLSCKLEYIPNDVSIQIESYLIDGDNQLYINQNTLVIDTFTVQLYRSSLPTSNFANYLTVMAANAINTKYNKTIGGYTVASNPYVSQITPNTSELLPGLKVSGDGIPEDTTLTNIRDTTSIQLSADATVTGSVSLTLSAAAWTIDYSALIELATIVNFGNL